MDVLNQLGWHLCSRRFPVHSLWKADLIYRKKNALFILETVRAKPSAQITADLIGPQFSSRFRIYYGYLDYGNSIDCIREWTLEKYIETVFISL